MELGHEQRWKNMYQNLIEIIYIHKQIRLEGIRIVRRYRAGIEFIEKDENSTEEDRRYYVNGRLLATSWEPL